MREIEELRATGVAGGSFLSDGSAASNELDTLRHRYGQLSRGIPHSGLASLLVYIHHLK